MDNQWFLSSNGTGDLSLTIKGLLLALVPLSVTAFQYFGYPVAQDQIVEIITQIFAVISLVTIVVGLIRKAFNRAA